MSPELEIRLDAESVLRMLSILPDRLRRKAIMEGLRDSARFLVRRLRAATPRRTGRTHRAIKEGRVRQHGDTFEVRIKRPRVFNLLESGAVPHEIRPGQSKQARRRGARPPFNPRKALLFGGQFSSRVQHPGFAGRKVFGPVAAAGQEDVARIFGFRVARTVREEQGA